MNRFVVSLALLVLLFPVSSLAHPDHSGGQPAHPTDSPDYHEIVTVSDSTPATANDAALLAMLRQLIEILQTKLAVLLGSDRENEGVGDDELIACTMDAFQCPDGSYVGRTGPTCEFVCSARDTSATTIETTGDLVMTTDADYRYFSSTGLPEYGFGGSRYANEPTAQAHEFRVPLRPVIYDEPTYYTIPFTFGIALNGVTFEPFAAEWYQRDRTSGWQEDPFVTLPDLDIYNAHVQPSGLYHYHGQPLNLLDDTSFDQHSQVIGFAADGFPLYGPRVYQDATDATSELTTLDSSYELKAGSRPSGPGGEYDGTYNEDHQYVAWGENSLDECNGRFGVTPEYPDGTYYYVATDSFPYIPRCLWGNLDASFGAQRGAPSLTR